MAFTYIRFRKAYLAQPQNLPESALPYKAPLQPFSAWYALTGCFIMTFVSGYTVFLPGQWDVTTFLFSYMMIFVFPVLYLGWKFIKKTKWVKSEEADLIGEREEIEEYHREYVPRVPRYVFWSLRFSHLVPISLGNIHKKKTTILPNAIISISS